jgi:hypothetical protein
MNASSISRQLRSLGFAPVAPSDHNRQGLKVRGSSLGRVRVTADLDSIGDARALALAARTALTGADYRVELAGEDEAAFYVSKN